MDIRVESLVASIHDYRKKCKKKLETFKDNIKDNIKCFNLIKRFIKY